jgi:hypothetical protein
MMQEMPLTTKLRNYLHERALRKYRGTNIDHAPVDLFNQIKSVGILFDANDARDRDAVLEFTAQLKAEGIDAWPFGFFNSKIEGLTFNFDYIDLNQLSFAYLPKGERIRKFIATEFDLLVNLDTAQYAPVNFIAAASKALFKIGPARGNPAHYDLMIDTAEKDLRKYIIEIRTTFNKISG